jgi:hypothetical protein
MTLKQLNDAIEGLGDDFEYAHVERLVGMAVQDMPLNDLLTMRHDLREVILRIPLHDTLQNIVEGQLGLREMGPIEAEP